jgi:SPX domain protein involved in polyphosphate accumulation
MKVTEGCKKLEKQVVDLAQELNDSRSRETEMEQQLRLREQQFSWRVTELEKSSKETVLGLNSIVKAHQSISEKYLFAPSSHK